MSKEILAGIRVTGEIPFSGGGGRGGGKVNASTTGTSTKCMVSVSPEICTALSGTFTIQNSPFGRIQGLKSCSWVPKLGSQRSSHISTKVPREGADFVAPALFASATSPPTYSP